MYLRTTTRKNKNGSTVSYYQLAHNARHSESGSSVAQIIHNFGRADQVNRDELVRLCQSIARVCGLEVNDPMMGAEQEVRINESKGLPKDFFMEQTYGLGTLVIIEQMWERLGIGPALRQISDKCQIQFERALFAMTANRLCEPESKLGVWERWLKKVYLPTCNGLKLDHMYESMDYFHDHCAKIEESVFFQTADLLNLEVDLIFYDTTTASFHIDYEDEDTDDDEGLRKLGRAKEGGWTPQVVVALAVTKDGLPVRSWVFPGNTTDVKTVEKVKADLKDWKLGRALFVADAGMNSLENRQMLAKGCGKYLLATRMSSVKEIKEDVLSHKGKYRKIDDNMRVKEVVVGDGECRRRYFLCHNPQEEKKQRKHRQQVIAELKEELGKHPKKEAKAQWAIELLASKRYKRYLSIDEKGILFVDHQAIREQERLDGKWVITTNDDTLDVEDAAKGYKGLLVIERCFRSLKRTRIKVTPMYHWLQRRIITHVKICILALLIERVIELQCERPWPRIKGDLDKLTVAKFITPDYSFYQRSKITPETNKILKSLEISVPKLVTGISKVEKT